MFQDPTVLLAAASAAGIIASCYHFYLKRREVLDQFERKILARSPVTEEAFAYADETATKTCWSIGGRTGEFVFTLEAVENRPRPDADPRIGAKIWFTLEVSRGTPTRFGEYGFGGMNLGSRADQPRLRAMFDLLWPDGDYPLPDTRPERARAFAPRSP